MDTTTGEFITHIPSDFMNIKGGNHPRGIINRFKFLDNDTI